jgi:hypothetical protein
MRGAILCGFMAISTYVALLWLIANYGSTPMPGSC